MPSPLDTLTLQLAAKHVVRWHTKQVIGDRETVGHHASDVLSIALYLLPGISKAALVYALQHDEGEFVTGDIPAPIKHGFPVLAAELRRIEDLAMSQGLGRTLHGLTALEVLVVRFADEAAALVYANNQHNSGNRRFAPIAAEITARLTASSLMSAQGESLGAEADVRRRAADLLNWIGCTQND